MSRFPAASRLAAVPHWFRPPPPFSCASAAGPPLPLVPDMPSPTGVVSHPVRVSTRRITAPSPAYSAPPATLIGQMPNGMLVAGPGPPTPPATVVIVPGTGPPARADSAGGAAPPDADTHAAAPP